jgi:valyl-tRNA synthetase
VSGLYNFVVRLRLLRAQHKIPSNKKVPAVYHHMSRGTSDENWATISRLAGLASIEFVQDYHASEGEYAEHPPFGGKIYLRLGSDRAAELERLRKEIAKVEQELRGVETKLSNKSFVERAPAEIVEEHRQRQKGLNDQLAKLRQARDQLG